MEFKPLSNHVFLEPLEEEKVTKSGIVLPDTADKEKKAQGKIMVLGNGPEIASLGIKVGDTVVFGKYAGEEVEVEENGSKVEYKILYVGKEKDDSDILALVE